MHYLNSNFARQPRPRDHLVMYVVRYENGASAYIRVSKTAAELGSCVVSDIALDKQELGEIPHGRIVGLTRAR